MARTRKAGAVGTTTIEQLCSAKEIVVSTGSGGVGKTTTAAALGAAAAAHLGVKVLVLTVDPARRLANALGLERFGNVETQVPASAFAEAGVAGGGRAVGRHAGHQAVLGRPGPHARTGPRHPGRHPGQPAVPEHHRQVRPEPRLRGHGAPVRDPHLGSLRPDRGGHPTHPQRHRLPGRAGPDGGLLLVPAAPVVDHAVPVPSGQLRLQALLLGGRPHPGHAVPGGHRRVLHAVPDHVRRLRGAGPGRDHVAGQPPDHVPGRVHPGGGPGP